MKKFLFKSLVVVALFSFVGILNVVFDSNFGKITVQAQQSIVDSLGNPTVYYTPNGKSFHLDRNCSRLSKSKQVLSGQLRNVISKKSDPCDFCVGYTSSTTSSQVNNDMESYVSEPNIQTDNVLKLNVIKEGLEEYLENAYSKAFGRDIDDQGLNYWTSQLSQGKVTIREFILNLVGSDEFSSLKLETREIVKRIYEVIFGRDSDDEGLNYWIGQLNKNLKNNNSKRAITLTVTEIMKSNELKQIADKIGILY